MVFCPPLHQTCILRPLSSNELRNILYTCYHLQASSAVVATHLFISFGIVIEVVDVKLLIWICFERSGLSWISFVVTIVD